MTDDRATCWMNTVSADHVARGRAGGFTQAGHGRPTGLRRLRLGDRMVFYSPRTSLTDGDPLQAFTAYGVVTSTEPYRADTESSRADTGEPTMMHGEPPWRVSMRFEDVHVTPIRPLVASLSFIQDPTRWGYPFRRGLFPIPDADLERIVAAMRVPPAGSGPEPVASVASDAPPTASAVGTE